MSRNRWKTIVLGFGLGLAAMAGVAGQCGGSPTVPSTTVPIESQAPATPSPTPPSSGAAITGTPGAGGIPAPYAGMKDPFSVDNQTALNEGAGFYYSSCQFCHGPKGKGDGPSATGLVPPPTDLTKLESLFAQRQDREFWIISEGIPGSAMPGFKDRLTEEQRWLIFTYEWSLAKQANK